LLRPATVEYFRTVHVWFPIFEQTKFRSDLAKFYAGDEKLAEDRAWLVCFNNVMLFGIFNKSTSRKESDFGMGRNFFLNGWAAIDDLEVFMAPRLRNVQALLTGVRLKPTTDLSLANVQFDRP
jgi:hypothetical protein